MILFLVSNLLSLDVCFTLQFSWVPKGLFNVSSANLTDPIMMVLMPCLRVIAEQIPFAAHVITHFVSYAAWPCVLSGYPCNYFVHRDVEASSSSLALASHRAHWHLAGFCHQKPGTAGFGALFPTERGILGIMT